ncbi:MAG TPA: glycoside hydrolase family 15 protein, partial [Casimicrobiaceae bacterium]|nr:glycoside hydrolase family 15 protein [Casimicrobiaceae bacterium]
MTADERGAFAARCIRTILAGQEPTGAYLACPAFPVYRFCWFRDSSFVADAMSRAGEAASADAFFAWAERTLVPRLEAGEDPHTRYTADGRESPVEWPTFQLDGFGLLLWALARHRARHGGPARDDLRGLVAGYLARSWRRTCTDWWEEQEGLHAVTLGCVVAGLRAEQHPAADEALQALPLADWRLDASLVALATPLEVVPPEAVPLAALE